MGKRKKKQARVPPTYSEDGKILIAGEGAEDFDEEGHVLVVTQFGLAMLVAGLRSIREESPEVEGLLGTLEEALAQGMEERIKKAEDHRFEAKASKPIWEV